MNTEQLLMRCIRDIYKGKIQNKTAIETMNYVAQDPDLQQIVNNGDWKALIKYQTIEEFLNDLKDTIQNDDPDQAFEMLQDFLENY